MKTRYITLLLFILLIAGFAACKKENGGDIDSQKQEFASASAQADAEADGLFDEAFDNAMGVNAEVGLGGTGIFGREAQVYSPGRVDITPPCFTVTTTQLSAASRFPLRVVINFGSGCLGRDGKIRRGRIIIDYTGRLVMPGSMATTTYDGYYIDSVKVEGTHRTINKGTNDKHIYETVVSHAKFTRPNGDYTKWNSDKTCTQIAGMSTPLFLQDDVFSISGHAYGSVKKGNRYYQWSTEITQPLIKKFTCRWFVKGTLVIKKSDSPVAVLDYGTGACDRTATFTVNGVVYEITLH